MKTAEEIVDAIIADLVDRHSIGDAWDELETDIQDVIRAEWIKLTS